MLRKKVLMVVGGTGGHIYPGIALAQRLSEKRNIDIEFIIDKKPLAHKILSGKGFTVHRITSAPLPRKKFWHMSRFIIMVLMGIIESIMLIRKMKPDTVVAFGAYISVPVVIAAEIFKIPVILHEQNYFPGLANKFLTFMAKKIAVSYKSSFEYFPAGKTILTGNPVRKELFGVDRNSSYEYFKLDKNKITILVFGGSQGSQSINLSVIGILPYLEDSINDIQFIHICGKQHFQRIIDECSMKGFTSRVYEYVADMEKAYSIADIIICRSGATTVAEITALGIPSILIPYPDATAQHQLLNAKPLCKRGGAICYEEEKLSSEGLALRLIPLIKDSNNRRQMSINAGSLRERFAGAADKLAEVIIKEMNSNLGNMQ